MHSFDSAPHPPRVPTIQVIVGTSHAILDRIGPRRVADLLHPWEEGRASRLRRQTDRDDLRASHALARLMAAWSAGLTARQVGPHSLRQDCPDCGSPQHGRPRTPGLDTTVRWAHADGLIAVACATGTGVPLGCDTEWAETIPPTWRGRELTLPQWCRSECEVKAGLGTLDERLSALLAGQAPEAALTWTEQTIRLPQGDAHLTVLAPQPALVTAWT